MTDNSHLRKRRQNEREFPNWIELPEGGRRYWRDRAGGDFGYCRYVKTVDKDEITIRFVQEIYDDGGNLIEFHQKYPVNLGHQIIQPED